MCNKNLRLNSPLKVNNHYSLLKHCNFDFDPFQRGEGVTPNQRGRYLEQHLMQEDQHL